MRLDGSFLFSLVTLALLQWLVACSSFNVNNGVMGSRLNKFSGQRNGGRMKFGDTLHNPHKNNRQERETRRHLGNTALFVSANVKSMLSERDVRSVTILNTTYQTPPQLNWYSKQLMKRPMLTKMLTSGCVAVIGDLAAQLMDLSSKIEFLDIPWNINIQRLLEFFLVNALFIGPALHYWFQILNSLPIPKMFADNQFTKALYQLAVDQTVGATWITGGFFVVHEIVCNVVNSLRQLLGLGGSFSAAAGNAGGLMEWLSQLVASVEMSVRSNLLPALSAGRMYWPFVGLLNLLWVPLEYRVLVSNFAAIFWSMFLSILLNSNN